MKPVAVPEATDSWPGCPLSPLLAAPFFTQPLYNEM